MDISGFEISVAQEIRIWHDRPEQNDFNSLCFQNHLYGCFSVLEVLAEGGADLSGNLYSSDEMVFDLSANFEQVGATFGFLLSSNCNINYSSNCSSNYKTAWLWAWAEIGSKKKIETVDLLESSLFSTISTFEYFKGALDDGSLPDELEAKALTLEIKPVKNSIRVRFTGLTRRVKGRRSITPIQSRRSFKKTRRQTHTL
jgi:hypothetical protein